MDIDHDDDDKAEHNQQHPIPSLVDLCMSLLVSNSEKVSSLDHVPDEMRAEIWRFVGAYRKMDTEFMRLLVAGSPQQIIVNDCSWMTVEQFHEIFRNCDVKDLRVLHLDLCGKCMFDSTLSDVFGGAPAKLCALASLSLKGATGLTDEGLESLPLLAPSLKSINLSMCSLITAAGIATIARAYKLTLKELYLDECPRINATCILRALMELKTLEVLSLAGIKLVFDGFICRIACVGGSNMKELRLADCRNLTDYSIKDLAAKCPNLTVLDLSNLDRLSDVSLQYLAHGCKSIRHLKLHRNPFSDEALGAFLKLYGHSLTELSLNGVSKVGPCTASSIASDTRNLQTLDLSWCRNISNEMLGSIVDSCRCLKLLKLFGCTQITEVFLKGHSNPMIRIVGPQNMPLAEKYSFIRSILKIDAGRVLSNKEE